MKMINWKEWTGTEYESFFARVYEIRNMFSSMDVLIQVNPKFKFIEELKKDNFKVVLNERVSLEEVYFLVGDSVKVKMGVKWNKDK